MKIKFGKLCDLGSSTRRLIHDELSYKGGAMKMWLESARDDIHMCLLYNGKLAAWAALETPGYHQARKSISAWTRKEYRGRGYAQTAIWAVLDHHKIKRSTQLQAYSGITKRILSRLKFIHPVLVEYNA